MGIDAQEEVLDGLIMDIKVHVENSSSELKPNGTNISSALPTLLCESLHLVSESSVSPARGKIFHLPPK